MYGKLFLFLACAAIVADAERRRVVPEPRHSLRDLDNVVVAEPRLAFQNYALSSINSGVYYQSPGYPSAYPTNGESGIRVTSPHRSVINVYCSDFNIEMSNNCGKDGMQLELNGDTNLGGVSAVCGQGRLNTTSNSNALTIRFFAGARVNPAISYRWRCLITAVPRRTTLAPVTTTTIRPATTTTTRATTRVPVTTTRATTRAPATAAPAAPSTCSCGVRGSSNVAKIVNGTVSGNHEFPWRCALESPQMGGAFCGATIIDNSWIMTAAHCTDAVPEYAQLFITCGTHNILDTTETTRVSIEAREILQHQNYNKTSQDNDISLIRLSKPLTYNSAIAPVCLPSANQGNNCDTIGTNIVTSGWGTTSSGGEVSQTLQKVDLPCIGTTSCRKYYGSSITDNMLCTYLPGKDTCQGDSGGSIDYLGSNGRYYGIGVVSWGVGCAGVNNPGVYTKVINYLPWIQYKTSAGSSFCKS